MIIDVTYIDGKFSSKELFVSTAELKERTRNAGELIRLRQLNRTLPWIAICRDEEGKVLFQHHGAVDFM